MLTDTSIYRGFSALLRKALALPALATAVAVCQFSAGPASAGSVKAVVELFTSQGCSSCPPADALAAELIETRDDLLVLSLAVDYWDFLGWPDTLADRANSKRQRAYALRRGDKAVYTPQIVVNGGPHLVGSDGGRLSAMIDNLDTGSSGLPVEVDLAMNGDTIEVDITTSSNAAARTATVWAFLVSSEVKVAVRAGENRGRKIKYVNVVRDMLPVGVYDGTAAHLRLPSHDLMGPDVDRIAILVQNDVGGIPGPILGGAMIAAPPKAAAK